jgi:hypothetical protein
MELIDSKSLLAKLMATENLTVEQRPVQTASFDVLNRILTIPTLDKNISSYLYDLFTGHEVGHALYTPMDGIMKARELKVHMGVANVVEDSRIERKIKYKYPGLKNSFTKAYQELLAKDFFGINGTNINKMNFIDRINLHCKAGAGLRIEFNDDERNLLNDVETTETYDDVIDVSARIVEYMKLKIQEEKEKRAKSKAEDGEDGDDDYDDFEEVEGDDSEGEYDEDFDSDELPESKTNDTPEKKSKSNEKIDDFSDDDNISDDEIRSFTDESFKKNENRLFDAKPENYTYVNIPEIDPKLVFDYKNLWKLYKSDGFLIDTVGYLKLRNESSKVVSYLVKEFEMRKNADQLKRASTAKTGDLDMKKMFSYNFNEDIFKKISVVPGGKSHGLVLFLDWSGSMNEHMANTLKQLINLCLFCRKVNIPFEVYAFTDDTEKQYMVKQKRKLNDIALQGHGLLNILSGRMNNSDFTFAGSALVNLCGMYNERPGARPHWLYMQGTPLNDAIIHAMTVVPDFQKRNKLQIVNTIFLTDGEGGTLRDYYTYDLNDRSHLSVAHSHGTKMVIRDTITKNECIVDMESRNQSEQTQALIKLLKLRTNSNVIGFYVISGREFNRKIYQWYPKQTNHEELKSSFRKDNFTILENNGYDEYYILRSSGLDTDEAGTFEVKENVTNRGIVAAFAKYSGQRLASRIVLNRFIGLIT